MTFPGGRRGADTAPETEHDQADRHERYVTFALAAAELLVEIRPDGIITYAAGSFEQRFGQAPEAFLATPVRRLLAPEERERLEDTLMLLGAQQRIPPMLFRLRTRERRSMLLSGLPFAHRQGLRFCLCLSAVPEGMLDLSGETDLGPEALARVAEQRLREGEAASSMGFLELEENGSDILKQIREAMLAGDDGDGVAGRIAPGRYGIVSGGAANPPPREAGPERDEADRGRAGGDEGLAGEQAEHGLRGGMTDLAKLAARVEAALARGGQETRLRALDMPLTAPGLDVVQATRALRHALSAFAQEGQEGLNDWGFDQGLQGFLASATLRSEAMRRALAERRFHMAYQPIVGLQDGRVHHYEALLRPRPIQDLPLKGPQEFVTFAEAIGLAEELDWAVLHSVAQVAQRPAMPRIAVNLSGLSLQSPVFRRKMESLLDARPNLAERLLVEITETAQIGDEDEAIRSVQFLRDRWVAVCLDDFGAGASAFRYLRALQVDFVKLDGVYVQGALRSARDRSFVTAIVELSQSLGAAVVAERIETEAEAGLMRELGVGFGQGFHFGRPGQLPGHPGGGCSD
ncbi:EAL domain-containing protein [Roseomonas gilardii]|uniref:EAL domain-containing protein n=1 Tax=Roseomonas gilardii TaxID=257708 RepID=A0ABU3MEB9_9PROT|nr:EAL domain-containing protein [Roseomonas gilardii]MDT8331157.1 EAL domain-containing protein [Roseomonas gilardii]